MHHIKPVIVAQSGKERKGRGFSPDELKEAGMTAADARSLKIPVDRKRRTSHEENVETLKAHFEKAQAEKPVAVVEKLREKKSKS